MSYLQVGAGRALVGQVEERHPRPALLLHPVDGLDALVDAALDLDGLDARLPQARGHHLDGKYVDCTIQLSQALVIQGFPESFRDTKSPLQRSTFKSYTV